MEMKFNDPMSTKRKFLIWLALQIDMTTQKAPSIVGICKLKFKCSSRPISLKS